MNRFIIKQANSEDELNATRELFREYADSLEISLCFQNFEEELANLPGKYTPPTGRLFLAYEAKRPAGCVALRSLGSQVCEMKRLYVRPAWRRDGLGMILATRVIQAAQESDYASMRLDTLASMKPALSLYHKLGFREITPYYENPSKEAVFMELPLNTFASDRLGAKLSAQAKS